MFNVRGLVYKLFILYVMILYHRMYIGTLWQHTFVNKGILGTCVCRYLCIRTAFPERVIV